MNITVIPHKSGSVKTFQIKKALLGLIISIFIFFLCLPFALKTKSYTFALPNKILQENSQLEASFNRLNKEYEKLKNKYFLISKKRDKIQSSFSPLKKQMYFKNREDLNEIVRDVKSLENSFSTIEKMFVNDKKIISNIPSILPVKGFITETFGEHYDKFTGKKKFCEGINIAAPLKSKVVATADGVVEFAGLMRHYGLSVKINHGNNFSTFYSHLKLIKVRKGEQIKRGDIIGLVGTSGKTIGPTLHYEVRLKGKPQNPLDYIIQEVEYF